ncbi:MAG: hypothetical protein ACR2HA_12510 [Nocardioides sp.]
MRRITVTAVVLAPALLLGGCGQGEDVDAQGSWLLVGASLPDGNWQEENGGTYFLRIEPQSGETLADGTSGCDGFDARVAQDGDDFASRSSRPARGRAVPKLSSSPWRAASSPP